MFHLRFFLQNWSAGAARSRNVHRLPIVGWGRARGVPVLSFSFLTTDGVRGMELGKELSVL